MAIDAVVEYVHQNVPKSKEETDAWWANYRMVVAVVARFELIASTEVFELASEVERTIWNLNPQVTNDVSPMQLTDAMEELKVAIRRELRIVPHFKDEAIWLAWTKFDLRRMRRHGGAHEAVRAHRVPA